MSKKNKKSNKAMKNINNIANDGFFTLVPRSEAIEDTMTGSQPWILKDLFLGKEVEEKIDLGDDTLTTDQRIHALETLVLQQADVIHSLQATLELSEEFMDRIYGKLGIQYETVEDIDTVTVTRREKPFFRPTINGIDIVKFTKETLPAILKSIDGVDVDFKPGRGISVRPSFRKASPVEL